MTIVTVAPIIIASGASNIFSCVTMSVVGVALRFLAGCFLSPDILSFYSSFFGLVAGFVICFSFLPIFVLPFVFLCAFLSPLSSPVPETLVILGFISVILTGDWASFTGPLVLESDILLCICSAFCIGTLSKGSVFFHVLLSCLLFSANPVVTGLCVAFVLSHCLETCEGSKMHAFTDRFYFLLFIASLAASSLSFYQFYLSMSFSFLFSFVCFYVAQIVIPLRIMLNV